MKLLLKIILFGILLIFFSKSTISQPFGSAIVLDGTSNFITVPDSSVFNITDNLTLEAWIKPCDLTGHNMIFTKFWCSGAQNSYYLTVLNGKLLWQWSLNACGTSGNLYESNLAIIQANVWQHVAVVHTSTGVTLYLNGVPVAATLTQGSYSALKVSNQPLRIGTYKNLSGAYTLNFNGLIDEARVWNTNLSSSQILARYNGPLNGNEPNLIAYYDMNTTGSGNGVTVTNGATLTGSGLNGATVGSGTWPFFSTGLPIPDLGNDTTLCVGSNFILDATTQNGSYFWHDSLTDSTHSVLQSGVYGVTVTVVPGCPNSDSVNITLLDSPFVDLGNDTVLCVGQSFVIDVADSGATYLWQDGSIQSNFSVLQTGVYWVEVTTQCGTFSDTLVVGTAQNPTVDLGADTILCMGDSLLLNVGSAGTTYLWQDNSIDSTLVINQAGQYWVMVSNSCGSVSDSINVSFINLPIVDLGNDTVLCVGQSFVIDVADSGATYLWQDGSIQSNFSVLQTGVYWVEVTTQCGTFSDTLVVGTAQNPIVDLGGDTILCMGDSLLLNVGSIGATYLWQDSSIDSTLVVNQAGQYWVMVSNSCTSISDSINVQYINSPIVDLGSDTTVCFGTRIILDVTGINATYLWQNQSDSSIFTVYDSGLYFVEVSVGSCFVIDSIYVDYVDCPITIEMPNIITLNGDGINDVFKPIMLLGIENIKVTIFNRWGQNIFSIESQNFSWDGKMSSGKTVPDGVYYWIIEGYDLVNNPVIFKGNVTILH